MVNFAGEISRVEFEKSEGLAQCFPSSQLFLQKQGEEMREKTQKFVMNSLKNIQ